MIFYRFLQTNISLQGQIFWYYTMFTQLIKLKISAETFDPHKYN